MMSLWIKVPLVLVVCYAVITFLLWAFQDILIFHPRKTNPAAKQYDPLAVQYKTSDNVVLRGWLTQQVAPPQAVVEPSAVAPLQAVCRLLIYFGGNAEEVSNRLAENHFDFPQLYVNYRGFGDSGGRASAEALRRDALFIYDETRQRLNIPPNQICVMGGSLGTHIATYVAANREIGKLVLVSPFDSVTNIARMRYPIFPVRLLLRHAFDTLAEVAEVRAPTLAILAENDWIVPASRSQNLLTHWKSPLQIETIPNTTHNSIENGEYWSLIKTFLNKP